MITPPASPSEDYILYADRRKMLVGFHRRMLLICVPMVVLAFAASGALGHRIPVPLHHPYYPGPSFTWVRTPPLLNAILGWAPWFLFAEVVFLWLVVGRSCRRRQRDGAKANGSRPAHMGEMSWDEVGEVRCYTFLYRYVGVVPADTAALCRRLGPRRAWLLWMNAACIPLYKFFGLFVAPINIPQVYLPIPAEELASSIRSYQAAYGRPSAFGYGQSTPLEPPTEGTWPPPPNATR